MVTILDPSFDSRIDGMGEHEIHNATDTVNSISIKSNTGPTTTPAPTIAIKPIMMKEMQIGEPSPPSKLKSKKASNKIHTILENIRYSV
jgi:hypothetical protein